MKTIISIILEILLSIGQAYYPKGYIPYVITRVDRHENYVTVYGMDSHGEYGCILDDVTPDWEEPWMVSIGQVVLVAMDDGYVTDAFNPDQYTRYVISSVVENQVPGYEPYYTIYAESPSGQVECILDDETKEWLTMIGQPVLIRLDDQGNMTDIRCRVLPSYNEQSIGQEGE